MRFISWEIKEMKMRRRSVGWEAPEAAKGQVAARRVGEAAAET